MSSVVLIHGGQSTARKLEQAMPGADVFVVYREGLSAVYDERTGLAKEYPELEAMLDAEAPGWSRPLTVLAFSAGGWALRYYLRDPRARELVDAAIFLDATYGSDPCNLAPYEGVVEYGRAANADPDDKRLIMTYSQAHPGPGRCARAISAAAGGEAGGVFVRGFASGDHGSQQGIVGPQMVAELVDPWLADRPARGAALWGWAFVGVAIVAGAWYMGRRARRAA